MATINVNRMDIAQCWGGAFYAVPAEPAGPYAIFKRVSTLTEPPVYGLLGYYNSVEEAMADERYDSFLDWITEITGM